MTESARQYSFCRFPSEDVSFLSLPQLSFVPFGYQMQTAQTVLRRMRGRAILADEVGLGKTIEAGLVLSELRMRGLADRTLVLTPAGLVEQWREELERKFGLPTVIARGGGWEEADAERPVVLASIAAARREPLRSRLTAGQWDVVVADEAHRLRNPRSASGKLARALRARYLLLLTATPVENRLQDLYELVSLVAPGLLGTPAQFRQRHAGAGTDPSAPRNLDELRARTREVMVRHRRSEVEVLLPQRLAETVLVAPSQEEAELYAGIAARIRAEARGASSARLLTLRGLTRLAGSSPQAAAPALAKAGWPDLAALARQIEGSTKADGRAAGQCPHGLPGQPWRGRRTGRRRRRARGGPMIRKEAGLAFWLDWVEQCGGLWEDAGDTALALLPAALASELELPEETAVSADPDVAREDGALLLMTGHPVVTKAAESVLAAGDTGTLTLAAPRSVPPDAATLLSKAREHLPVDHGRLDPRDATPERALRAVLRVGALVGYELSAEDHFQEQAEVFVDVPSRLQMPTRISERLARTDRDPRSDAALPEGLGAAVHHASASRPALAATLAEAHRMLEAAAVLRRDGLAGQIGDAYAKERARAEDYYAAAVDSLQRRAATAPEDRAALLRARIDSTREERARRLAEIAEKYRARHTLTPYRLHLLRVPVLRLALDVRRGERRYPLDLDWLLPAGEFAPLRCPACAQCGAPLVAAKTHLGCARCLARLRSHCRTIPMITE